jgi:hypothetical protein
MPKEEVLKRFDFGVNITKAWVNKETGKHYVKAIASDTGVDHHGERFSEKAIDGMVSCIEKNEPAPVLLLPTHWDTFEIGKAVEAKVVNSPTHEDLKALEVVVELDMEYPQAKSLYKEVESGNALKQLSVGGYLNPDSDEAYFWEEKEYETEDGNKLYDYLLVLNDLVLDHIAVTRKDKAANPRTGFSEAIAKSLDLDKPVKQLQINKEAQQMTKIDKQAESLSNMIAKSIKDFFKSNDADQQKIQAAKDAMEAAKSLVIELGDDAPEELKEQLKALNKEKNPDETITNPDEKETGDVKTPENPNPLPQKTEDPTEPEVPAAPVFDAEQFKSSIIEDLGKSLGDAQQETFKDLAKSLGDVIAQTIKSQVEPLQNKISELENVSGKSKSLDGQEDLDKSVVKSSKSEDEDDNMWAGIIKSAIPSHVLAEKLAQKEGGNE